MTAILVMLPRNQISDARLEDIHKITPDKKVMVSQDRDEIEASASEIEIAVGMIPNDVLKKLHNLRWLQQWSAGADWLINQPDLRQQDFILTSTSGIHAIPISEHVLMFLLAFARGLPQAVLAKSQHNWQRHESNKIFELAGKTILLVGVGSIGQRTASLASGLGMRVLGLRRNPAFQALFVEKMYGPDDLLYVLPQADFVVLAVPWTPETQGMIGEAELKAMKPTAFLVNIGRGRTIQQDCLVRALQEGWIAGAGLDVFETEPLPADSPLWDMENVILTPHISGQTPQYAERALDIFVNNLKRYQAGEPLRNVVDKRLVY